jgi:NhaB family Na+:H+ antiporter
MTPTLAQAFARGFLGEAPGWYKLAIVACLVANPIFLHAFGPVVTGWLLLGEFIFTLAMALRCYPLQPGGLLAIQSVLIGLTTAESVC